MVADESSDPDMEKQQPPLPTTTKADDHLTPPGCWWHLYMYCKTKACSWPAALSLAAALMSGAKLLLVAVARGSYLLYASFALQALPTFIVTSLVERSFDTDDQVQAAAGFYCSWCRHKAAAVALVVVLEAGIGHLLYWGDVLEDCIALAFLLHGFCVLMFLLVALVLLPDPDDDWPGGLPDDVGPGQDVGRWRVPVLLAFLFGVLWSLGMIILVLLVMLLTLPFILAGWLAPWTVTVT